MTRSALPQNYIIDSGPLLDDFENINDYSVYDGTKAVDSINFKTGTNSLKIAGDVGKTCSIIKNINSNLSTEYRNIGIWIYFHTDPKTTLSYMILYLAADLGFVKHFYYAINSTTHPNLSIGWNYIPIYKWTNVGMDSWNDPRVRLQIGVTSKAGQQCIVSFDSWFVGVTYKPKCLIMFDDGNLSAYTEGFNYMQTKGLKGTLYLVNGASSYITVEQLQEMYDAGWALGNHASIHESLKNLSQPVIESRLLTCANQLLGRGFERCASHVAYPFGDYDTTVLTAMISLGMKTGRTVTAGFNPQVMPPINPHVLSCDEIGTPSCSLATAKNYIAKAMDEGKTAVPLFHHLVAANPIGGQWLISDFQAFIDYIIERGIECVTIDEWYEGLTNPRYRSIPLSRTAV